MEANFTCKITISHEKLEHFTCEINTLAKTHVITLFMHNKIGSSETTSQTNTWMVIGSVMIVVVVIVTVALIATCFRHRQILHVKSTADTENIQNAVYEGHARQDRELPQIPQTDGDYEQPAEYAQPCRRKLSKFDRTWLSGTTSTQKSQ